MGIVRYRASRRTGIKNIYLLAALGLTLGIMIVWKNVHPLVMEQRGEAPKFGRAVQIFDGDTFKLANGMTVRMLGVEAPTEGKAAQAAHDALATLIWGKKLTLKYGVQAVDDFGRLNAWVWVDGKLVQQELVDKKLVVNTSGSLSNLGEDKKANLISN